MMLDLYKPFVQIQGGYRMFGTRWVKLYAKSPDGIVDKITEAYVDDEIKNTWRNTPSENMNGVELHVEDTCYRMKFPDSRVTEFWQSDDYVSAVGGGTVKTHRRVQMKMMEDEWLTLEVAMDNSAYMVYMAKEKI